MQASEARPQGVSDDHSSQPDLQQLEHAIEQAAHLLPAQGPITVFIHHNTLHALEELPFAEAVKQASTIFGCHPYWPVNRYRDALRRGRIRHGDLLEVVRQDLGEHADDQVLGFGSRLDLRMAMMQHPLQTGTTDELVWYVAEVDSLGRFRHEVSTSQRARLIAETRRWVMRDLRVTADSNISEPSETTGQRHRIPASVRSLLDRYGVGRIEKWKDAEWEAFTLQSLWRLCCDGVRDQPMFVPPPAEPVRHRDWLLAATGDDSDILVHEAMTRLCAAFLDQGLAPWSMPRRTSGLFPAFCWLYRRRLVPAFGWMKGIRREVIQLQDSGISPLESIRRSLVDLGVPRDLWNSYISETLVALRGWGGMLYQVEHRADRVVQPVPAHSLTDMLAVRLILDRRAVAWIARERSKYPGPLAGLLPELKARVPASWPPSIEQRAFVPFQLAQVLGLSPDILYRLQPGDWRKALQEVETFSVLERRRVFHLAYENSLYTQVLDAIALHAAREPSPPSPARFQAMFCLDERQESIRRHLEEAAPDCATFGTAGFFSVPVYYRGIDDAHFVPLCPPAIVPRQWLAERVVGDLEHTHQRRIKARRALGKASHTIHRSSRSLTLGALLTSVLGVAASIPLVARVLFPRFTAQLRSRVGRFVETPVVTRLQLERVKEQPGPENGHIGFTVAEMADIAERVLREIGLTVDFAPILLVVGHGSTSMGNPHASAYDCGACGGARGGPNARALAQMLNDPRVREQLAQRGIVVPSETHVVGCMHNTTNDTVTYFDLDLVPGTHVDAFDHVRSDFETASERNAHERSRRFQSAPLSMTYAEAKAHVETRAEDLAQVRPELGHATNALCFVGPRSTTRGLFFDRRAFLVSYDEIRDDSERTILSRILSAAVPVCAGISLEYYFSAVDNHGWGAGTKLPHNITSLLGVMDGSGSDLRTGLPWQMVEIHEPVRLLFVIEVEPEPMLRLINRNQVVGRLCRNGWVRLAVLHPRTRQILFYQEGAFQPYQLHSSGLPSARSSVDWYRGWRDHLEFAEIEP